MSPRAPRKESLSPFSLDSPGTARVRSCLGSGPLPCQTPFVVHPSFETLIPKCILALAQANGFARGSRTRFTESLPNGPRRSVPLFVSPASPPPPKDPSRSLRQAEHSGTSWRRLLPTFFCFQRRAPAARSLPVAPPTPRRDPSTPRWSDPFTRATPPRRSAKLHEGLFTSPMAPRLYAATPGTPRHLSRAHALSSAPSGSA